MEYQLHTCLLKNVAFKIIITFYFLNTKKKRDLINFSFSAYTILVILIFNLNYYVFEITTYTYILANVFPLTRNFCAD